MSTSWWRSSEPHWIFRVPKVVQRILEWPSIVHHTVCHFISSHRSKGTLVHAIHHRSPKKVDIFPLVPHKYRAVVPFLFSSITTSEWRNVLIFLRVFKNNTPKMGHWLLHISAPCACVPPSSQLYIHLNQKQHYSHRFKTSQTTPEVRRKGWFFMFLTSDIVENSRDGHTLSFRSAPSFQSVWSIIQASIDHPLAFKRGKDVHTEFTS